MIAISLAVAACGACWAAGLWLFVTADISTRRKLTWSGVLVAVGAGVGVVLPMQALWGKAAWAIVLVPLVASADVFLFRSRGLAYWLRACGFEVVTVFATAMAARYGLDLLGIGSVVGRML